MGRLHGDAIDPNVLYEFVEGVLDSIESLLDIDDIDAAKRRLRSIRRALGADETSASQGREPMAGGVALTGQEAATLRRLVDGSMSQKGIAQAMGVSRNTLKTHLKSLYLKLGAHSRGEAIERARELGLLSPPLTLVRSVNPDRASSLHDIAV